MYQINFHDPIHIYFCGIGGISMSGLAEMYQDYIDGKRELREINMEFNARYVSGGEGPSRGSCVMN